MAAQIMPRMKGIKAVFGGWMGLLNKKPRGNPMRRYSVGVQQDDNYKEFMDTITDGGLRYAHAMKENDPNPGKYYQRVVPKDERQNVIIVGAGMSGLAAAYELAQNGHKVTILEAQSRVGGRVKTFRDGFQDGLHCEGGAMRLPYNHYLTKHYIDLFGIETEPFQNENDNGYLYLYGEKIRLSDWKANNRQWTDHWFPGWDANVPEKLKGQVDGILDLYRRTIQPVKNELGKNPNVKKWRDFVDKWSVLSFEDFLRTTTHQDPNGFEFRPWPEAAITAYKVSTYTPQQGGDIIGHLREELGAWWEEPLYTQTNGMDSLPKSMVRENIKGWNKNVNLSRDIVFGFIASRVDVGIDRLGSYVQVSGVNNVSGESRQYRGNAVILTVPLNILRQIDIPSFSMEKRKAVAGVTYEASTKIMLQCKTRFWQKDVGQGGFSKTDMPIGQLHYPDHKDSRIPDDARGILLVYTWARDALTFGAEASTPRFALASAIKEISKIHPEIVDEFEVGNVQAWYSDPSSQGAFAALRPHEYLTSMDTLATPSDGIYLAGEAISWSNGWIQGAIYSGLMAAYSLTDNLVQPEQNLCHSKLLLQ